jgi:hypothetical protein
MLHQTPNQNYFGNLKESIQCEFWTRLETSTNSELTVGFLKGRTIEVMYKNTQITSSH